MLEEIEPLALGNAGFAGWMSLFLWGFCALFASLGFVFVLVDPKPNASWSLSRNIRLCLGAGALAFLASAFLVYRAERAILLAMRSPEFFTEWDGSIQILESTYLVIGSCLFFVALLVILGVFIRAFRERGAELTPPAFQPLMPALLILATATGILIRAYAARNPYRGAALAGWEAVWLNEKSAILMPITKNVVLGVALVSTFVLLGSAAFGKKETRARPSRRELFGAAGFAGLALFFWLATRPLEKDGNAPLPFPHNAFGGYACPTLLSSDPQALPRIVEAGERCSYWSTPGVFPLAVLDLGDAGPSVDGKPVKDPQEAFRVVNALRLERGVDNPRGRWPVVLVAAPASMPAEEIGPWLGALATPQQRVGLVVVHDQAPFLSATVGTIERKARCSCPLITLDRSGLILKGSRWGEIGKRAAEASADAPLVVAP